MVHALRYFYMQWIWKQKDKAGDPRLEVLLHEMNLKKKYPTPIIYFSSKLMYKILHCSIIFPKTWPNKFGKLKNFLPLANFVWMQNLIFKKIRTFGRKSHWVAASRKSSIYNFRNEFCEYLRISDLQKKNWAEWVRHQIF